MVFTDNYREGEVGIVIGCGWMYDIMAIRNLNEEKRNVYTNTLLQTTGIINC
jgi:hypothetical protein